MESSSQLRESFLGTKSSNCSSDSNRASACSLFNVIEADYLQSWDNQETSGEDGISNGHTTSSGFFGNKKICALLFHLAYNSSLLMHSMDIIIEVLVVK